MKKYGVLRWVREINRSISRLATSARVVRLGVAPSCGGEYRGGRAPRQEPDEAFEILGRRG